MKYKCYLCQKSYSVTPKIFKCECGGFLNVEQGRIFPKQELEKRNTTIWRYREAFGLPEDLEHVSLGEGHTPLIMRQIDGNKVLFKMDFLQPTGSFKDRGASVLISVVKTLGIKEVVEDSSGNAGAAISAYSTSAGIACTVFVPDYTPEEKLTQIKLYGAKVVKVPGKRQDANDAAIRASKNFFYASHLWNPLFVSGTQSAAFEIWEELGEKVPPLVVLPVGSGGFLEGLFMGFRLLFESGYSRNIPRIVGVQAQNCQPIHSAFTEGLENYPEVKVKTTIAEGISVQRPPRARAVLKAIRDSNGYTVSVSENEIIKSLRILLSMGIYVEPTSASALAGWHKLSSLEREGAIVILTGNGLKESNKLQELMM